MKRIKRIVLFTASGFLILSTFVIQEEYFLLSVLMGISLALIFFILADAINRYFINRRIKTIELKANEQLLLSEPSTRYFGSKGVMGKLFLTNQRIVFQPQIKLGQQKENLTISKRQIKTIGDYDRAFLPTGIEILTRKKERFLFAVDDRKQWKEMLNS